MKQINNKTGFTLIEVLIATLVIVFGMLAMGTFLGSQVNKNSKNERKTYATVLAQGKIEELRNQALVTGVSSADDGNDTTTTTAGPFTRTWTIDDTTHPLLDEITVEVVWAKAEGTGAGADVSKVTLSTQVIN
jgi:prepilin-type N-terminal cleavage/methylation domain-containing protein